MNEIDILFRKADFSKETDHKQRLAKKLFGETPENITSISHARKLQDEELGLVSAAKGYRMQAEKHKN